MGTRKVARPIAVLATVVVAGLLASVPGARAGTTHTYVVLYRGSSLPADTSSTIRGAGGDLVYAYPQIGVAIARSSDATFRDRLLRDNRIEGAAATEGFGVQVDGGSAGQQQDAEGPPPGDLPNAPATDADNLSALQWDMRQIHAPEAHAITGGSPSVVVGDIDTGLDYTHPDLSPNVDFGNSVSCIGGVPDPAPSAWFDVNGHGTHTAGTIAAASNGVGIVGVAPNVKVAGIKAGNDDGYFFPEAVICAFYWAGSHHLDVTNNSYFADPFLFNCRNDPEQRAIWKAEQRAIRFAMGEGVTVVAAEGNESEDLSHPTVDATSPDFPPGTNETREVTNACVVIPVEVPGVIGTTADGHNEQTDDDPGPDYLKSFYSSYGVSTADVTAPGGDSIFGTGPEAPNGRVLSTWPNAAICPANRTVFDPAVPSAKYCYAQGTSMASPHAAGVAALIISMFGDSSTPQNGKRRPGQVLARLQNTADPQPCPTELPPGYAAFTGTESGAPQVCQGGRGHNSWYGSGQVNALSAIS
jgi:lantibiotic leader peptide-processing serine protease